MNEQHCNTCYYTEVCTLQNSARDLLFTYSQRNGRHGRSVQSYAHTVGYCSTCISMHRDTAPVSRDWNLSVFSTVRCSVERCMSAQRTLYSRTHDLKCYTRSQPGQSHPCGPSQEAHTALRRCVAESHQVSAHYVPPAGAHRTDRMRNTAHAAGMFRVSRVGRASHAMKSLECSDTVARGVR